MSLKDWVGNGWLRPHEPTRMEIAGLCAIVDRDLLDCGRDISPDWRFGIAYNAALKLCTVLLHASGYRAEKLQQHHRTVTALPLILGESHREDAEYLDNCRMKRNTVEYDMVGAATAQDAAELAAYAKELREVVLIWLTKNHPELVGEP